MLSAAEKRRHADLLAARDKSPMAQAQARLLRAEADLDDALVGCEPAIAELCTIIRDYPILGRCVYEGGRMIEIGHPWGDAQCETARAMGVDVAWQWRNDPAAGLDQGELIRIWIGTRDAGPKLQWDDDSGRWSRLASHGDYGRNRACGGTWRQDGRDTYAELSDANPEIARVIERALIS